MFLIVNFCHGCFTKVSSVLGCFSLKFSWAVAVEPCSVSSIAPLGAFSSHWGIYSTLGAVRLGVFSEGCFSVRRSGKHLATRRNSLKGYDHPKITSWVVYNEFFEEVTIYNPEVVESVTEIKLLKLLRRALSLEVTLNPVRKVNTIATNMSNKMNMWMNDDKNEHQCENSHTRKTKHKNRKKYESTNQSFCSIQLSQEVHWEIKRLRRMNQPQPCQIIVICMATGWLQKPLRFIISPTSRTTPRRKGWDFFASVASRLKRRQVD